MSKYSDMANAPSKMMPFKKQTSRERGIYHKPLEELPKMEPGYSTQAGYWPTQRPPSSWAADSAEVRGGYPAVQERAHKHTSKDEHIAYLAAQIAQLRSPQDAVAVAPSLPETFERPGSSTSERDFGWGAGIRRDREFLNARRVGRPRTATVSHEVLWSEMPNSLYRSHAVERAVSRARGELHTGRRPMRAESRSERRTAVPVSIPYM